MTTIHRDDVTGEEHRTDSDLYESGIYIEGTTFARFDSVEADTPDHVDAMAEKLHGMVNEWAADRKDYIENHQGEE